jgi:transcriptional regulator with XRE-family HTH domain
VCRAASTARTAKVGLGARIAQLRKEAGLSQPAVADALEIAQQTYANNEVARARPAVSMLPTLSQLFGVSVDELLGLHKNGPGKRGPTPLLQKQIERLNRLPKAQQKIVMQMSVKPITHAACSGQPIEPH